MKLYKHMLMLVLIFSGLHTIYGQENTRQEDLSRQRLGLQYYQNKDFVKSLSIFSELYREQPNHTNYTYCFYSMMELREYQEAEKLVKRHIRKNEGQLRYRIDLGYVYISASETEKAHEQFETVIEDLPARPNEIRLIASTFYSRNQLDYAIKTYQRGKELMEGGYSFDIELATMYERNGNYEEMVETFLDHLKQYPEAREDVQNRLQAAMGRDIDDRLPKILRETLLIRYQENPDEIYLNELLLWLSVQQKDFSFAFLQARSLDRRFNEEGYRVLDIADLALRNKDYDAALESYEYVMDKGKDALLYLNGLIGFLETRYRQMSDNIIIDHEGLLELESAYLEAIDEFGIRSETMQLLRDLAHIQAFYLSKESEAVDNLILAIDIPGPESYARASCKIELADIYLFQGEVWEATLLYSQVEKSFKNEPIGHLAKLNNARLTYYIGEFEWAKAQLDVLKAATSKLIANDALELSLHIADNIEMDSSYAGLSYFATAELLFYQNKFDESYATLDSISIIAVWHPLFDEVLLRQAEIRMKQGKFAEADTLLYRVYIEYPGDILADDALFRRAQLQEEVFKDALKAMELYQHLLKYYPGSIYTIETRKRFRILRGDAI